jgi:two-component system, cell cycle sensor histidine kinase and response regulator CckA
MKDRPSLPSALDFRALFESAPDLYLVLTPGLTILAASDTYLRATMTVREKIVGLGLFEVFPDNPDDPTATGIKNLRASLDRVLENRTSDAMPVDKYDIRRPESEGGGFEERYWSPVNSAVLGERGEILFVIHRIEDVSEFARIEDVTEFARIKQERLEQHKATLELRDQVDQIESEVFRRAQELHEANRQLRDANEALSRKDEDQERVKAAIQRASNESETRVQARTAAELETAVSSLRTEVVARKRAVGALAASEQSYRLLFESIPHPMWVYDVDTLGFLAVNDATVAHYGYSAEELLSMTILEIEPPDDIPVVLEAVQPHSPDDVATQVVRRHRKRDGTLIDVEDISREVVLGGRRARLVLATDITSRKRQEEALRENEERYRTVTEAASDTIITIDEDSIILFVNSAAEQAFGYTTKELLGQNLTMLIPGHLRVIHHAGVARDAANGKKRMAWNATELSGLHKSGREVPLEVSFGEFMRNGRRFFTGIVRDNTERERLHSQLRQSQKMEAIGELAGGIAHDFNNLLTVISGYSELALTTSDIDDKLRHHLNQISEAGKRARLLVAQLLAFSRKQLLQPRVLDLNEVVSNTHQMLGRLIGEDIDLVSIPRPGLGHVLADAGQIEQIILNLSVNARDAMPSGGKLTIETDNVELDENYARNHAEVFPGRYVLMAVSDTGYGIDAATRAHIFEPFFTTKSLGKGTGLGLSTVYGIVKQSSGHIWLYSEPGKGTTFKVYLPRVDEPVETSEALIPSAESLRGSETLLLAEDEEAVRKLARSVLELYGYNVLEAPSSAEAIDLLKKTANIALLITDVVMPQMSGKELAANAGTLSPETRILYLSGYTDIAIFHHGVLEGGESFLAKPFTKEGLARKVREVLDQT